MPVPDLARKEGRERGHRAEEVAAWYLRVNGFLAIPGFIVHLDQTTPRTGSNGERIIARTEADLVAVRFPYSQEVLGQRAMLDDERIVKDQSGDAKVRPLFVLCEVKAGTCDMNGPWTNPEAKNMQRVLRRMGFTKSEATIEEAASKLYGAARWEGSNVIAQYVCFGSRTSAALCEQHASLIQITWSEIGEFLFNRHSSHPEKTPGGLVHKQWPRFGRSFGDWFVGLGRRSGSTAAAAAVSEYVSTGNLS